MRPILDAGLCIESSRGSSLRAAAVFSRAFWGVFRKKVFSAVAATPCWNHLPREDGEVRRLGSGDFLALLERRSAGFVESLDVDDGAVALQDFRTSCRWATTTWPQPGLQLLDGVSPTRSAALGLLL